MSTALAVQPPSHSSPLRPRDPPSHHDHTPSSSPRVPATLSHQMDPAPRRSPSASSSVRRHPASHSPAVEGPSASSAPSSINRPGPHAASRNSRSPQGPPPAPSAASPPQPNGATQSSPNGPVIKKEQPASPDIRPHASPMSQPRHRPRRLDLSRGKNAQIPPAAATVGARPSGSGRDSGGLHALHDVAAACLSPGFQTHDPSVQHQLARSMEMKEQQRQIIEARLRKDQGHEKSILEVSPQNGSMPRRKGKPPGLSINAPSPHHFAGEPRFVRTAPLDGTFTGLRPGNNLTRQVLDRHNPHQPPPPHGHPGAAPGGPGPPNSLPPISSVLNHHEPMGSGSSRSGGSTGHGPQSNYSPHYGAPSPGYPPPPASAGLPPPPPPPRSHPPAGPIAEPPTPLPPRQRDFKSAEEYIASVSQGREDMMPKVVHYSGPHPPTPPSPRSHGGGAPPGHPQAQHAPHQPPPPPRAAAAPNGGLRRTREEYERDYDDRDRADHGERRYFGWDEERGRRAGPAAPGLPPGSAPAGAPHPQPQPRYAPISQPKDSPDAERRKKDEFMSLASRMWDLLRS